MRCPTKDDTLASLLALLPTGRAWQTNEGGPEPYHDAGFDPAAFSAEDFDTEDREGSVLYRFWEAVASAVNYANERLCALALEFFCATQSETNEQWMFEYGLPDACDPFPDLCAKVAAIGGSRCPYFQAIAARAGWSIACIDVIEDCGGYVGEFETGEDEAGGLWQPTLVIVVDLANSPSYVADLETPALIGVFQVGGGLDCEPDITALKCLMDRIVPAHVTVEYQTL